MAYRSQTKSSRIRRGSPGVGRNFGRLAETQQFRVSSVSAGDTAYGGPWAPVADEAFSATGAYDRVLALTLITLVSGIGAFLFHLAGGVAFLAAIVAMGLYYATLWRPTVAHVTAPIFAVAEGAFLGILSWWASYQGFAVVALAVLGTVGIYFGVLVLYRTALVRVTPGFVRLAIAIGIGTVFAALGSILFSMFHIPLLSATLSGNLGTYFIFGVLYLLTGVMGLFVDFSYIDQAAASRQFNRNAEWFASMSVLVSLVTVFLGLLRMLGAFGGSGSRR
jgi:uncharacterized YccA/Bax inhibitor family protein